MTLSKAIICDIDGTIALLQGRDPYDVATAHEDLLNYPISNILEVYANQKEYDIRIILLSGRQEHFREVTEKWLQKHGIIHYEALHLRKNKDFRKDTIVKKEIYEMHIRGKYEVLFVLEDRDQVVKMWREEGLICLQVAYGNF